MVAIVLMVSMSDCESEGTGSRPVGHPIIDNPIADCYCELMLVLGLILGYLIGKTPGVDWWDRTKNWFNS